MTDIQNPLSFDITALMTRHLVIPGKDSNMFTVLFDHYMLTDKIVRYRVMTTVKRNRTPLVHLAFQTFKAAHITYLVLQGIQIHFLHIVPESVVRLYFAILIKILTGFRQP